jgi:predicted transglutaminase-like cysteine proteinase
MANWRELDYWATPLEFLARSGDCEDFAIAKYQVLRALGVPIDDMRIVIVNDRARRATHAVLAVYVDGRPLILDNLRNDVVAADLIGDYEPVYSINEQGWWLHRR